MKHRPYRTLARRSASRPPLKKFTIFCEGKNTEPGYFQALRSFLRSALIEIETLGAAGTPYTIARTAIESLKSAGLSGRNRRKLNSYEENDEIWAVFDRDEHP